MRVVSACGRSRPVVLLAPPGQFMGRRAQPMRWRSHEQVSRITDPVMGEVKAWQALARPDLRRSAPQRDRVAELPAPQGHQGAQHWVTPVAGVGGEVGEQHPAAIASADISITNCGLVANSTYSGTPPSTDRAGSLPQDSGRYNLRSRKACPSGGEAYVSIGITRQFFTWPVAPQYWRATPADLSPS